MFLDSAIHFPDIEFPWEEWDNIVTNFGALPEELESALPESQILKEWKVSGKGAHVTLVLVNGVHGGERFHWKIMLSSVGGDPLQNSWLKYAIPYEFMGLVNCVFSDYTTEEVKESPEDLLVFAKKNLTTVFTHSSLRQAGYMSSDNQLLLTSNSFKKRL